MNISEAANAAYHRPLSENERFWLEVIRLASYDRDPPPTLQRVQRLRQIFMVFPDDEARTVAPGGCERLLRSHW